MDQPTQSFKMPSNLTPPEPMGGQGNVNQESQTPLTPVPPASSSPQPANSGNPPLQMPSTQPQNMGAPERPKSSLVIIVVLILVLVIGSLLFISWKGWVKIGFMDKLWGKSTPVVSPSISPKISPIITSSPEVSSNINDETRKSDLAKIKAALKIYFTDKSAYPIASASIKTSDTASVLATSLVPTYLDKLPDDPQAPNFYYGYKSDGKTFELTAVLEDKSDTSGTVTGSVNLYKITNLSVE